MLSKQNYDSIDDFIRVMQYNFEQMEVNSIRSMQKMRIFGSWENGIKKWHEFWGVENEWESQVKLGPT